MINHPGLRGGRSPAPAYLPHRGVLRANIIQSCSVFALRAGIATTFAVSVRYAVPSSLLSRCLLSRAGPAYVLSSIATALTSAIRASAGLLPFVWTARRVRLGCTYRAVVAVPRKSSAAVNLGAAFVVEAHNLRPGRSHN